MKPILAAIALLLVSGCASKPKPMYVPYGKAAQVRSEFLVYLRSEGDSHRVECERAAVCVTNLRNGGISLLASISHVTREQWEAAQGLYNPKRLPVITCDGCAINTTSGILFSISAGTTAVAHFKKPRLCPRDEHRALIDIPIQREGVACAGTAISDCAEHHVIDVCEKNHDPFGDTFPPSGDAK